MNLEIMVGLMFWVAAGHFASKRELLARGGKVIVRRSDDPIAFWTLIALIVLVGVAAIVLGVLTRNEPYHLRGTPLPPK
jgi:hypothetical protein